jgi:serine/threonine protein kinase
VSSVDVAGVVGGRIGQWVVEDLVAFGEPQRFLCRRGDGYDEETGVLTVAAIGSELEVQLEREYEALRTLDHEGVPRVLDFGRDRERGVVFLATDFFDGDSLADWLITGPLDWRDACQLVSKVASALQAVHNHSLVHRDVSPSKILVGPGWNARLVGFEVALDAAASTASAIELTPGQITYVAPEVIAQDDYGPRADLYALGVVFFEAITGKPAFPAALRGDRPESNKRILSWKTRAEPLDPGDVAPPWLARLIQKATHPDAAERLPDMEAFIGWLDAAEYAWKTRKTETEPIPVSAGGAPPPIMAMPTFAAPTPPSVPTRNREQYEVTEVVHDSGLSPAMSYLVAVVLGVFAAFGFSALVIVIAEVTLRG